MGTRLAIVPQYHFHCLDQEHQMQVHIESTPIKPVAKQKSAARHNMDVEMKMDLIHIQELVLSEKPRA